LDNIFEQMQVLWGTFLSEEKSMAAERIRFVNGHFVGERLN
jgi:hypothetical protein